MDSFSKDILMLIASNLDILDILQFRMIDSYIYNFCSRFSIKESNQLLDSHIVNEKIDLIQKIFPQVKLNIMHVTWDSSILNSLTNITKSLTCWKYFPHTVYSFTKLEILTLNNIAIDGL